MSAETDLINSLRQSLLEANQAQATLASKLSDMTAAFTVYDAGQQPPPQNGPYTLGVLGDRSEEHTSELQSLMRISYAVFCLKKKKQNSKAYTTRPLQTHTYRTTN